MSFIKDVFFGGAEKKAARAQQLSIDKATDEQRRQFDLTREDLAPSREAGNAARERLLSLVGLEGPEAQQRAFDKFIESPGQAFLRKRGERALVRNASAIGGLGGGNVRKALVEHGIGTAAQQEDTLVRRLLALVGQGDISTLSGAEFGQNTANNISNLATARGSAEAQGILGRKSAIMGTIDRIMGGFDLPQNGLGKRAGKVF